MSDEELDEEDKQLLKSGRQRPLVDGKTIIIGGGVIAAILFFFFRGGGGGKLDKQVLELRLRRDGLWLGHYQKFQTYSEAIARIKAGGKTAVILIVAGDVPQGEVDKAIAAFTAADITISLKQPQTVASLYQRGMGGIA
jgi:hypothetical protein